MQQLIKEVKKTGNDGAVMYRLEDGKVTHISPLVQAETVQELYNQLSDVRDAIADFLNELVDRGLPKN